jgi:hypothetical protein
MTVDGAYVFQLSHACGTGTATSQVQLQHVRNQLPSPQGRTLPEFVLLWEQLP